MKKITLILICIVTYMQATGQESYQSFFGGNTTKYHIFLNHPTHMHENDSVIQGLLGGGTTWQYLITKEDTVMVNDTVYYKEDWYKMCIREDTTTGQLFRYIKEQQKEYLICDMSLNVGDTFTLPVWSIAGTPYTNFSYVEQGKNIIVDSIAYVNGKKVIYFSNIEESLFYESNSLPYNILLSVYGIDEKPYLLTFIEGIGPTFGPFGYISLGWGYLGVLLCVEKDDTLMHITSPYLGCAQIGPGSIAERKISPIRLYPNPATDKIHIELDNEEMLYGMLQIIDPIGQVVYSRILDSNKEIIPIKHLSAGLYILQYTIKNQRINSKFIKK